MTDSVLPLPPLPSRVCLDTFLSHGLGWRVLGQGALPQSDMHRSNGSISIGGSNVFLIAALCESRLGHTLLRPVHSSGLIETSLVCGVASSVQSPSTTRPKKVK